MCAISQLLALPSYKQTFASMHIYHLGPVNVLYLDDLKSTAVKQTGSQPLRQNRVVKVMCMLKRYSSEGVCISSFACENDAYTCQTHS